MKSGVNIVPKTYTSYIIAFCATIIRYYDYAIFGLFASILSKNFMFGENDSQQMLAFFAAFSVSMFARPFGSIFFGKIADKVGRVVSVRISIIIAAISISLIIVIPRFDSIGWYSVGLLIFCRMLFLASFSGEVDAIKIYVSEKISKENRHFAAGLVVFSSQVGVLLASVAYHITVSVDEIQWLWKVSFLFGGILGLFIAMMGSFLKESKLFLNSRVKMIHRSTTDLSIMKIISQNGLKFSFAVIVSGMLGGVYHFLVIFFGSFSANIAHLMDTKQAAFTNIVIIALYSIASLISGYVADKVKMSIQVSLSLICSIVCVLIMCIAPEIGINISYLHCVLAFIAPFYTLPCNIKLQSLFSINIRVRMCSLSHSLGSLLFSSTTPLICMLIWQVTGEFCAVLAYFLLQLAILFTAVAMITKNNYKNMFEL